MAGLSYKNKYERYSLTNYKIRYFKRYDVAEDLKKALKTYFGFSKFKVGQEEIVNHLLKRNNLLAVMPTGSGKSLCYQLPALLLNGRTIIVSPLIALMDDQVAYLQSLKLPADKIHSNRTYGENASVWRCFMDGSTKILYISPERLMTKKMLEALGNLPIEMFVVDEAHCISKWGASFRPEYERLSEIQEMFPDAFLSAFTATADNATRQDIVQKLMAGRGRVVLQGFDRPNLSLSVILKNNWKRQLLEVLDGRRDVSGIIYTLSRKDTEIVSDFLNNKGFTTLPYHAGQEGEVRTSSQDRFMTEPGLIMVATIAFGMGIDKPDIRFVVHTSLPGSMEAFYQEIGRAGRDDHAADTILLYGLDDLVKRRRMIEQGAGDDGHKFRENKRLDALLAYCEASGCRKKALLSYFGEETDKCGNCDNCIDPPELFDGTVEAQILLSAITRTGEYFGRVHVVDVILGSSTDKVRKRNHDKLPIFGKGQEHSKEFWMALIRQLFASGDLYIDLVRHGALRITESGRKILSGEKTFRCKKIIAPKSKKRKTETFVPSNHTDLNQDLFNQLKQLRLSLAQEKKVPAFVIFSDRTLIEMAEKKPKTLPDLLLINGVGDKKLDQYGRIFLGSILEHLSQQDSEFMT